METINFIFEIKGGDFMYKAVGFVVGFTASFVMTMAVYCCAFANKKEAETDEKSN